ncbi:MAG: condensation domain-containing protein, partial [Pseudomonadota bacterium]|nr:condensation domain-containing protein [Pseudomonadota bacterium]
LIILNGRNVYPQDVEFAIADAEPAIRPGRLAAFAAADAQQGREALVVVAEPRRPYLDPRHHSALFARMRQAVQAALDCTLDRIVLVRPGGIPMTTSGKISRQGAKRQWLAGALAVVGGTADPEPVAVSLDTAAVRRRIAAGEPAADVWLDWLRGQIRRLAPAVTVLPEEPLIACGLDSVTLLALHGVLEAELGWQDGPGTLFGDCSVQALAAALARHKPPAAPEAPPMPRDQARQSYAQRRLWFLHQLAPDSPRHNIVITLSLQGPLEADALERALMDICRRHGPLRTLYADRPDGPVQIVLPQPLFALVRHDLDGTPPEAQGQYRQRLTDSEGRRPFALERGEALRAHLLRYGPQEHDLLLCLHHIAFDGRSAEILLEELSAGYAAARRGETPPRVAPTQSYADFAEWEAARLDKGRIQQALDFWRDYLDGVPQTLNLPREPGGAAGPHRFHISHDTCAALARLSQAQGQTLFMTLLSLFGVLLHYLSRQDRFLVGTDVSGRSHPQWQGLIGFFVNQLPLRCDLAGAPTLSAIMARVRRDAQAAYAHQDLPFDLLVSALAPQRAHDRTPLFQVKLNYQRNRSQGLALDDVRLGGVRVDQQPGGFALVLDLVHGPQGIAACLKYDAACFGVFQMHRFASLWQRLLGDAEGLLPLGLDQLRARLAAWDDDLQRQQQRRCTAADRSRLGQIRRRPLHELPGDSP